MARRPDIKAGTLELNGPPEADLAALHKYVEDEIIKARDWYFKSKQSKKYLSQFVRYAAITFSASAGILPIAMGLWPNALNNVAVLRFLKPEGSSNLAISLLAALATAFIGLDRFGGFSTGWIRYVKVAQQIDMILQEFRLDWAAYLTSTNAQAPARPAAAAVATASAGSSISSS